MRTKALHLLISVYVLSLTGCSTIPRPDLGVKKAGGKTYRYEQTTILGKPVGKPKAVLVESNWVKLRKQLQRPAVYTLSIALPLGLVLGAAMMVGVGTPAVMQKVGTCAMVCLTTAVLAGAWLLATTWLLLLIPILGGSVYYGYTKTKHKKLTFGEAHAK